MIVRARSEEKCEKNVRKSAQDVESSWRKMRTICHEEGGERCGKSAARMRRKCEKDA